MKPVMSVEKITPAIATEYLKTNKTNPRGTNKLNRDRVIQYATDMKSGRWELNGESIVFDDAGRLKDGFHRMAAVVMSGATVQMCVVRNIDEDISTFDIGYNRTLNQLTSGEGVCVNSVMQSAMNLLFFVKNNRRGTPTEVMAYIKKNEDEINRAWRCMLSGNNTKNVRRGSLGLATYLMLVTNAMPFYELEVFFKSYSSGQTRGTEGYEVTPAIVARKMFDELWPMSGTKRQQREQLDVAIQAMLDLHNGRKRERAYKIMQPFSFEPWLKKIGGC